ncbi:hypothetical protein ACOMHN_045164 [Nucella lapillus]
MRRIFDQRVIVRRISDQRVIDLSPSRHRAADTLLVRRAECACLWTFLPLSGEGLTVTMTACASPKEKLSGGRGRIGYPLLLFLLLLLSFPSLLFANQGLQSELKETNSEDDLDDMLAAEHFMLSNPKDRHSRHERFTSKAKNVSSSLLLSAQTSSRAANGHQGVAQSSSPQKTVFLSTLQLTGSDGGSVEEAGAAQRMREDDYLEFNYDMELAEEEARRRREEEEDLAVRFRRAATDEGGSGGFTVNGNMKINLTFTGDLANSSSNAYKQLATAAETQISARLQSNNISFTTVSTENITSGSTLIEFEITLAMDTVDRVPIAEALLTFLTTGFAFGGQILSVLEDPQLADNNDKLMSVRCIICGKYPYKKCVQSTTDSTVWLCQTKSDYFFDFGSNQGDKTLQKDTTVGLVEVRVPAGMPYGVNLFDYLFVSLHGLISVGEEYSSSSAQALPVAGRRLLCGYWTRLALPANDDRANVWYQVYNRDENSTQAELAMLTKGGDQVEQHANISSYEPVMMLVVTFEDVPPAVSTDTSERANFQMAVITDGFTTYGMTVYAAGGMQFNEELNREITLGYGSTNFGIDSASPDTVVGNTGNSGVWFFPLSDVVDNPAQKCQNWYLAELPQVAAYTQALSSLPPCPCARGVAAISRTLSNHETDEEDVVCFRTPRGFQDARVCCYRNSTGGFLQTQPQAGSYLRFHPDVNINEYELKDELPKEYCCFDSDFCDKFYTVRPISTCAQRINSTQTLGTGDPHFNTLDGKPYTFNGIGEYTFIKFQSPSFEIQARTSVATNSAGKVVRASVFSAFAAKGGSSTLQVEMSPGKTSLVIIANGQDLRSAFSSPSVFRPVIPGLSLERLSQTSLGAYFTEGVGLTISVVNRQLTIQLDIQIKNAGPSPTGLLGNMNGNPDDDFVFPNSTTLPGNASERDLLSYGKTWAITDNSSLFIYEGGWDTSHFTKADFQPIILSEISNQTRKNASRVCGGDQQLTCIYDFVATEDQTLAVGTKAANEELQTNIRTVANRAPSLTGPSQVRVKNGEAKAIQFSAQDDDANDAVTYSVVQKPAAGFTFNETAQTAVWKPNSSDVSSLELVVKDSQGVASPSLQIRIMQCSGCNSRGICDFDNPRRTGNQYFQFAACVCQPYYSGQDCGVNRNYCVDDPCPKLTNCTDWSPEEHMNAGPTSLGYNCSQCPEGYLRQATTNAINCEDVDECKLPTPPCQQGCTNTVGSYVCSCNSGYRKDTASDTRCIDIDECQRNLHNCQQQCVNTEGGFNCSCFEGFSPNATADNLCVEDQANKDLCLALNCTYACRNESGTPQCFCTTGFQLKADQKNCEDTDECKLKPCSQNCSNTDGSYTCSCYTGYQLDTDKVTCKECPASKWGDNCEQSCDCRGHGTCDKAKGCVCNSGWSGVKCSKDVNECKTRVNACPANQLCQNNLGSFACVCPTGFKKVNETLCIDIDECSVPSLNSCPQKCTNTPGSFTCSCQAGYSYNATTNICDDIDECQTGISNCQYQCKNFPGSANCICGQGFQLNDDRRTCMEVEDPCQTLSNAKNCSYACRVDGGAAQCYCANGFQLGTDGINCIDINECITGTSNKCSQKKKCANTQGNYQCSCSTGYSLDNDQRTCTVCDENHWGDNCSNTCDCNPLGVQRCDRKTGCDCKAGWQGTRCELDIDECQRNACSGISSSQCDNTVGSFRCQCTTGYTLNAAANACEDVDECGQQPTPCDQGCLNTVGSFVCSCAQGFNPQGSACVDINECLTSKPCDQLCQNTVGGYFCECRPGFLLNATTKNTCYAQIECGPNSCEHGCVRQNVTDVCFCRAGFKIDPANTSLCSDIDECEGGGPCVNGTCKNGAGSFSCACANGTYMLTDRVTCQVCSQDTYGPECSKNCSCVSANTQSCDPATGSCSCLEGWMGVNCQTDKKECSATLDPCADVNNSQCEELQGSYRCNCNKGFFTLAKECRPCDDLHYGDQCSTPCTCARGNTADCNNINGTCTCKPQWKGVNCTEDVDECSPTDPCATAKHEKCRNTDGGHVCDCVQGFDRPNPGTDCQACDDLHYGDQCSTPCTCARGNTADCNNINGTCTCKPQWKGDNCTEDVDECSPIDPCAIAKHEKCNNTVGGYVCDCVQGFNRTTPGDCQDINECDTANRCQHPAEECVNSEGSYDCVCARRYANLTGSCQLVSLNFSVVVTLGYTPAESLDNSTSPYYLELSDTIRAWLRKFYKAALGDSFVDVVIKELRNGSVIVTSEVKVDRNGTDNPGGVVVKATKELLDSKVSIDGSNVSVASVTLNQAALTQNSSLCAAYTALTPCNSTQKCTVHSTTGLPYCREEKKEEEAEDLDLVIGLSVGIPLFFVAVLVIAAIVYIHIRRRRNKTYLDDAASEQTGSVFAGKLPTMGQFDVRGVYRPADNRSLSDSDTSDRHLMGGNQARNGRPDFKDSAWFDRSQPFASPRAPTTDRDGEQDGAYSWDWLNMLHTYDNRPFEIRRPQVIPSSGQDPVIQSRGQR